LGFSCEGRNRHGQTDFRQGCCHAATRATRHLSTPRVPLSYNRSVSANRNLNGQHPPLCLQRGAHSSRYNARTAKSSPSGRPS
jgi:hypothetical protein